MAAYRRHKRRGEDACEPCVEAQRERGRTHYYRHQDRYIGNARRRQAEKPKSEPRRLTCPVCAGDFDTRNAAQVFCSATCRWRHHHPNSTQEGPRRRTAERVTPPVPRAVGSRWRKVRAEVLATEVKCGICGQAIDLELRNPHPRSAQVDHIVPRVAGGAVLERANLRAAHRECNQRRDWRADLRTSREWS